MKPYLYSALMLLSAGLAMAQDTPAADADEKEQVHYALILPDEKSPETIRPDENNPFESAGDSNIKEENTEETRVRDIMLGMPAKGGGYGPGGMRVMLGSMRLQEGQMVPEVVADQQVMLKVKSITPKQIELVWVEKKPSGLPPKPFVIDVDVSPSVRYKMPSGSSAKGGSGLGTIRMEGLSAFNREEPEKPLANTAEPVRAVAIEDKPVEPVKDTSSAADKASTPPPAGASKVPEASVMRMLFGNHALQKSR